MAPTLALVAVALCAAAACAAAAAPQPSSGQPPAAAPPSAGPFDVVIVGAGIAGLAAAQNLTRAGLRVVVLEARKRTGGRLQTVDTVAGHKVDLGAMWIHSANSSNPLYALATELGLNKSRKQNYNSGAIFRAPPSPAAAAAAAAAGTGANSTQWRPGRRSSLPAYVRVVRAWDQRLEANITRMRRAAAALEAAGKPPPEDLPLADSYRDWAAAQRFDPGTQQGRQANLLMHTRWQTLLNANATDLSTLRYGDAKKIPADDVMLAEGMQTFTDRLGEGVDVRLGTVVMAVHQDAAGVSVETADGPVFAASLAIVTLPLGVLKANTVAFEPPLPERKHAAIDAMGFGVLDKLVLVWDKPWWPASVDFVTREMPDWSGRWSIFLNYAALFNTPILVALNAADTARELEGLSDDALLAGAMQALGTMSTSGSVPPPKQAIATRWAADPLARGSYSYFAVDNPRGIVDDLAEPFGRVLFAGEATSRHPATAHGAYESGLQEAARALSMLAAGGVAPSNNATERASPAPAPASPVPAPSAPASPAPKSPAPAVPRAAASRGARASPASG